MAPLVRIAIVLGLALGLLTGVPSTVGASGGSSALLRVTSYASPASGAAPLNVYFQANVSGGTGVYSSIAWTFGDGAAASGVSVRHTYAAGGSYSVTLEVVDSSDGHAWANLSVQVTGTPSASGSTATGSGPSLGLSFALGAALGAGATAIGVLAVRRWRLARPSESPPLRPRQADVPTSPSGLVPAPAPPEANVEEKTVEEDASRTERRRISEEIVVHLLSLGRLTADEIPDPLRTQQGMVARLDVPQNVLSPVLRRLTDGGVVHSELRHVRGRSRRLKVYALTDRGIELARELRVRRRRSSSPGGIDPTRPLPRPAPSD
ncbi:MAG TPA: PKD domain-containing protein [Thermoplasmata archaeon]|nr:PKD domain-containing protein [Thermoplasmata archaeon]